jgi:hypothetical protein
VAAVAVKSKWPVERLKSTASTDVGAAMLSVWLLLESQTATDRLEITGRMTSIGNVEIRITNG